MSFHEKLKDLRTSKGLTQYYIAHNIGVAKSTYSLYESGKRQPDVKTVKKIASFFNVTTDDLLDIKFDEAVFQNANLTQNEYAIIMAYRNNPDMQLAVARLLGVQNDFINISDEVGCTINKLSNAMMKAQKNTTK